MKAAIAYVAPTRPMNTGTFFGGAAKATMVKVPDETPEAPDPAMARPTISAVLLGASAMIKLPSSKMKSERRKVALSGKYLNALPHVDWKEAKVRKKAEPYQPTWSTLLKSSVMRGMAVAMMVASRFWMNMASSRPKMTTSSALGPGKSDVSMAHWSAASVLAPAASLPSEPAWPSGLGLRSTDLDLSVG